jgi:predicted dehydrogenase
MKVLFAGLGSVGRRHLRNLVALTKDDPGPPEIRLYRTHRSTLPEAELSGYPVETELEAALAWGPEAVIVANPTALHLDVAIPAARAGCNLLLEKPVSHSLERVDELRAAVRQGGGQVLVAYQFRFHPGLRLVRRWLAEAAIGRPLSFRAVYGEYMPEMHPWEDYRRGYSARQDLGGGVILTFCHPLDLLRWLFGEASRVAAFTGPQGDLGIEAEDVAEIAIRFQSGPVGSVHLNYNQRPPAHTLEITGTAGSLRWDARDGTAALFQPQAGGWRNFPAVSPSETDRPYERNDMFLDEMRHFLAVVDRREAPICDLEDGLGSLRLALAALHSAGQGLIVAG